MNLTWLITTLICLLVFTACAVKSGSVWGIVFKADNEVIFRSRAA